MNCIHTYIHTFIYSHIQTQTHITHAQTFTHAFIHMGMVARMHKHTHTQPSIHSSIHVKLEIKLMFNLKQATKVRMGVSSTLSLTSALDGVGGRRQAPAPFPREILGTHCIGGWVGHRAGLNGCGKSRHHPHVYINTHTKIMPLLTEYYNNTCLQDITVNISVYTPPMHIGPAQVLCTSHCRYQIGVTGLYDTKSSKLSVTINSSISVTIHFLLNYFPNLLSKNM